MSAYRPEPGNTQPNFDVVARPYRWMEYATFGSALQRCRTHFLPRLLERGPDRERRLDRRRALILGDGDGRFSCSLVWADPEIEIDAVDTSGAMLQLLQQRCAGAQLRTHRMSALEFVPRARYDLIVSHFFLDCLTQAEVELLVARLTPHLATGGVWVVSEFRIPPGWMKWAARTLVAALYGAFRLLTGLRTNRLPDHPSAFAAMGFSCIARQDSLAGLLRTELWRAASPSVPQRARGHFIREMSLD